MVPGVPEKEEKERHIDRERRDERGEGGGRKRQCRNTWVPISPSKAPQ